MVQRTASPLSKVPAWCRPCPSAVNRVLGPNKNSVRIASKGSIRLDSEESEQPSMLASPCAVGTLGSGAPRHS